MPKKDYLPFANYFIFILITTLFAIIALTFAIISLSKINEHSNHLILFLSSGLISITALFVTTLFFFRKKISEVMRREKLLNDFLQKNSQSKTAIIKLASHDIKNYAFGISGMLKLILQNKTPEEIEGNDVLKMAEELHLQSEELMQFVEDIFDISCGEDEDLDLENKRVCNVVDLAKRMLILNKNLAMKSRITLELDNKTKCKIVQVECNVKRLKQILNKLICNAITHSKSGSLVILQLSLNNSELQISVIDQGIGMTLEEIKLAISENKTNFVKLADRHDLDMFTMQKIIESYDGKFEINSVKNFGSEFVIKFPIQENRPSLAEENYEQSIDNRFENKAVLIAEDNLITSRIITFLLRKMGFNVKHVENGEEILEQLDKQHFDLIFLDINMPKLGGFATAKAIREGKVFKRFQNYDIPIIAISTEKQELSDLKSHGINMMLGKPFSEKELIDFVIEYVK